MLQPNRTKFRKHQKGGKKGVRSNTTKLEFGRCGLKALESGRVEAKTIEAVRRVMTRRFKRSGQIWIRIFPDIVITTKPSQVRMGKGKGGISHWVCRVQPGQILYEITGVSSPLIKQAATLASHKLGIKVGLIDAD
jgi:large subunit ribosomal protein L16|uniref:Large ribosomal subunit protein uL16m n=1 Tax=Botryococcus braunii Showa TaxID=1202541 RepID=A0A162NQU0_BOTBR|nr:ribosomal protein L16 (mitochondrion) [Botryococcus braunii Showa]